jgi:hypothetical protein
MLTWVRMDQKEVLHSIRTAVARRAAIPRHLEGYPLTSSLRMRGRHPFGIPAGKVLKALAPAHLHTRAAFFFVVAQRGD